MGNNPREKIRCIFSSFSCLQGHKWTMRSPFFIIIFMLFSDIFPDVMAWCLCMACGGTSPLCVGRAPTVLPPSPVPAPHCHPRKPVRVTQEGGCRDYQQ